MLEKIKATTALSSFSIEKEDNLEDMFESIINNFIGNYISLFVKLLKLFRFSKDEFGATLMIKFYPRFCYFQFKSKFGKETSFKILNVNF